MAPYKGLRAALREVETAIIRRQYSRYMYEIAFTHAKYVQYELYLLIPHRLVKESFKNSKKKIFFSPQTPVPYDGGLTVTAYITTLTHHTHAAVLLSITAV